MPLQDPDPGEIAAISNVRRRHNAGEGNCVFAMISQPPRAKIELGHSRGIEERELMQIGQSVDNVIIGHIDDTNSVHGVTHCGTKTPDRARGDVTAAVDAHLPSTTLRPSQTAPMRPVAITVITALTV